ncbi:DUF2884 family protein [Marilutibacter aestuarii]|uniref:DUF2884 family protein n=1 Tax=Marilutibacter aestuarii TaxID=1706195 RepID=A0A508ARP2_9GAMM|nr:DUF2884 family protein [Lysobacter aestuarii]TQD49785.1 DUF2884 family protein [Lysobacter aestuarii]
MTSHTHPAARKALPALVLLLGTLPWLSACGGPDTQAGKATSATAQAGTALEGKSREIGAKVREKMATEDIGIDSDQAGVPDAKITPEGDFLVDGKQVAVNAEQRALLLKYRQHITEVAASGAEIGVESASVATQAVGAAIASIFSGESSEDLGNRIEADVEEKIRGSVAGLCAQLPALMETQQALVAVLPAFEPYADMDDSDFDDCMDETSVAGADPAAPANEAAEAEAAARQ